MANSNGWGDGAANNSIGWGQGANNNIGWGNSHAKSWAGLTDIVGIDADAQAFITAAAITDPTQQTAINNLVVGMKADGTWTKMKAIYPFVGGTATTHKWNLKDPRDLDAAFRLVFNGGWTHSSNGATPNGTNGYADTKLNGTELSVNSQALTYYSRTNTNVVAGTDIGISGVHRNGLALLRTYFGTPNTSVSDISDSTSIGAAQTTSINNSTGYFIGSRISATSNKLYRAGVSVASNTTNWGISSSLAFPFFIGSNNSSGTAAGFTNRQCAFSTIGDGLTDTEAANLYTRVQAFQTSLNRQV